MPMDPRFRAFHGLIEVTVSGGYSSPALWDLTNYTFSLCERCLRELFDGCKIPPMVTCEIDGDDPRPYQADDVRRDV